MNPSRNENRAEQDGSWNVWLSRSEYEALLRMASTFEREIAIRLMGDRGLRVQEVLDVQPAHISRMTDGRHSVLEVVGGKDTTGEYQHGKHRETWLPRESARGAAVDLLECDERLGPVLRETESLEHRRRISHRWCSLGRHPLVARCDAIATAASTICGCHLAGRSLVGVLLERVVGSEVRRPEHEEAREHEHAA